MDDACGGTECALSRREALDASMISGGRQSSDVAKSGRVILRINVTGLYSYSKSTAPFNFPA